MTKDNKKTLQMGYAEAMKPLGRGHGFYDTESTDRVCRGMCGYIDRTGLWKHIVDITDRDALNEGGYSRSAHLVKSDPYMAEWSPVTSNGVRAVEAAVGSGLGVGAKVRIEYSSAREYGAILLCNTPVVREGFEHASVLRKWGKSNASKILENCPETREFGFHIVQTTWLSEDVYINAWLGEQKTVSISGTVRLGSIGKGDASICYGQESSAGGWVHPIPMMNEKPSMRVLFFAGLHFKFRVILFGNATGKKLAASFPTDFHEIWTKEYRGTGDSDGDADQVIIADPDDAARPYEMTIESTGPEE